jgi:hypothetical protein
VQRLRKAFEVAFLAEMSESIRLFYQCPNLYPELTSLSGTIHVQFPKGLVLRRCSVPITGNTCASPWCAKAISWPSRAPAESDDSFCQILSDRRSAQNELVLASLLPWTSLPTGSLAPAVVLA